VTYKENVTTPASGAGRQVLDVNVIVRLGAFLARPRRQNEDSFRLKRFEKRASGRGALAQESLLFLTVSETMTVLDYRLPGCFVAQCDHGLC
jgi:hypothetical protein